MKFLLVALLACLALTAQARPSKKTTDEAKQLITLLKKLVMEEVSKKDFSGDEGSGSEDPYMAFEIAHNYLVETFGDALDTPVFEAEPETIGHVFGAIVHIFAERIPEGMGPLVLARFTQGFLDYAVYESMCKIWTLADQFYWGIYEMQYSGTGSGFMYDKKTTSVSLHRRSKNFERLNKAITKVSNGKRSLADKMVKKDEDYSGYEPGFFDVVYERLIMPGDLFLYDVYSLIAEHDPYYYGSFFYELQYMAEDEGLLSRSMGEAAFDFAGLLARYMFEPPYDGTLPGDEIAAAIVGKLNDFSNAIDFVQDLSNFDDVALEGSEREAFLRVVSGLAPMVAELKTPLNDLASHIMNENDMEISYFFLGVAAHALSEQYETLRNVINVVKQGAEVKKEVIERLIGAIADGRGEEFFVALFTKMAHNAMAEGYRLDDYMHFAGMVLDQVDRDLNPGAYGSGDAYNPEMGFRGNSGASKRFLEMRNKKRVL